MKIDARPFFTLAALAGSAQCLRPKFNARSVGVGGGAGSLGTVDVTATHTVKVLAPLPAGLKVGAAVTVDDTTPPGRYRVVGVAPTPAGASVYLAADPAEGEKPYVGAAPDDAPRTAQRLPYVATDREP